MEGSHHPIKDEDRDRYANLLAQMRARIDWAMNVLRLGTDVFAVESAAQQLRKVIELVALGSLVTNRGAAETVTAALERKDWNEARKLLRSINPRYWPHPTVQLPPDAAGVIELGEVTEPYITEEMAGPTWGYLSDLLHAVNPYQDEPDYAASAAEVARIGRMLVVLLDHHQLFLADSNFMAIGQMRAGPTGTVAVSLFDVFDQPPPHWPDASRPTGTQKPGRNAPCWCGSAKKYKLCHGASTP